YEHITGWELWQSDGSTLGTQVVADLHPGSGGSLPQELTAVGNNLYFRADDGTHGEELWVRAGNNAPVLVQDLDPLGSAKPRDLTAVGDDLFFSTIHSVTGALQVWRTDGTAVGTELAVSMHPESGWDTGSLVEVGEDLLMSIAGDDERDGWELWKLDTMTLDATLLATFPDWGQWLDPWTLAEAGDRLYFAGFDGTLGHELWTSDGTVLGTKRLTDINPRVGNTTPMFITGIGDKVYFAANDGNTGIEPYIYDPSGFGMQRLANIAGLDTGPKVQISLAFDSDSGYENDDWITNVTRPAFVVDVNRPGVVTIDFNDDGVFEFSQAVDNWGTRQFTPATPLADGVHTVTARFTANSVTVEDDAEVTIDTVGPSLIGSYPVEDTLRDFHTLFFDEPINEEHLFHEDFLLTGPGITEPIDLKSFFIDFATNEIDVGFAPLTTPGLYTITIDSGLEDMAANLLRATSPNTTSFQVLANPVFLDDPMTTYTWNPSYEGKDLVLDGATLQVSGEHDLASLWLLNGATIQALSGQALGFDVAGNIVIDDTSTISADGQGFAGGATGVAGSGTGAGAAGTTGGGGGGYGGVGGIGGTTANAPGGTTYGVVTMPVDLGSGAGGSSASTGGAGGGAIKITAVGTIQIHGTISANGLTGVGTDGSGGSGGSVWLIASSFQRNGTIQ
ncbi:MAG TPA: Ig-like domain-containing protein, partial [Pirellulaceae bacterium]